MEHEVRINYSSIINVALIAITLIILGVLFSMKLDTLLKNNAVDNCAKNSLYTKTTATEKVSAPLENLYKTCLKDKGY